MGLVYLAVGVRPSQVGSHTIVKALCRRDMAEPVNVQGTHGQFHERPFGLTHPDSLGKL